MEEELALNGMDALVASEPMDTSADDGAATVTDPLVPPSNEEEEAVQEEEEEEEPQDIKPIPHLTALEDGNREPGGMSLGELLQEAMNEPTQTNRGEGEEAAMTNANDSTASSNPNDSTVESPTTVNNYVYKCVFCEQLLSAADQPKLLECLHNACNNCVNSKIYDQNISQDQQPLASTAEVPRLIQCIVCATMSDSKKIIDNQFLLELAGNEDVTNKMTELKCSCGDDVLATSYCVNCEDFICDSCVQAHQRIKVTKEHTIKSKDEGLLENQNYASSTGSNTMFCQVHTHEKLSLFCENCDKLTCRDCQLTEHRNHKYKFTHEIAADARKQISEMLHDINYKRSLLESAMNVIDDRQTLINEKKLDLMQDISTLVVKLTNAINTRGKELISRLSEVCDSKSRTLHEKRVALGLLSKMTDDCIEFTQQALDSGSDMAVLCTKRQLTNHLVRIKAKRADIPNPEIPVRINLTMDKVPELIRVISSIGQIVVDGRIYPSGSTPAVPTLATPGTRPPFLPSLPPLSNSPNQPFSPQSNNQQQQQTSALAAAMAAISSGGGMNQLQMQLQQGGMARPQPDASPQNNSSGGQSQQGNGNQGQQQKTQQQGGLNPMQPTPYVQQQQHHQQQQPQHQRMPPPYSQSPQHQQYAQQLQRLQQQMQQTGQQQGHNVLRESLQHQQNMSNSPGNSNVTNIRMQNALPLQVSSQLNPNIQANLQRMHQMKQQQQSIRILTHPNISNQQQVSSSTHPHALLSDRTNLRGLLQPTNNNLPSNNNQQQNQQQVNNNNVNNAVYVQTGPGQYQAVQPQYAQHYQRLSFRVAAGGQQGQQQAWNGQQGQGNIRMPIQTRLMNPNGAPNAVVLSNNQQQQQPQQASNQQQPTTTKWHIPQTNDYQRSNYYNPQQQTSSFSNNSGGTTNFKIMLRSPNSNNNHATAASTSTSPAVASASPAGNSQQQQQQGTSGGGVTSTIPKTPSPNHMQNRVDTEKNLDKFCEESVKDLMATIAKLDSNGVQVLAESRAKLLSNSHSPHVVDSSTGDTSNLQQQQTSLQKPLQNVKPPSLASSPANKPNKDQQGAATQAHTSGSSSGGGGNSSGDPNEDWCAVCMDGGELVCCDKCPKVFHQFCHIPNLRVEESETWQCLLCMNFADIPETNPFDRKENELTPREKKIAERIVLELYCQYEPSLHFREVIGGDNIAYHEIIKNPIALDTIRHKVDWSQMSCYTSMDNLVKDVRLMFKNAYTFNPIDSNVYQDAKSLEKFFDEQLEKWVPHLAYELFDDDVSPPKPKYRRIINDD